MKHISPIKQFLFFSILITLISSCDSTRRIVGLEDGWEVLGESKVNFVRDKDVIPVQSRSSFTAIRFRVEDKDITLSDLKVQFDNGDKLEPAMDEIIKANESSRIIELSREGRVINNIEFRYRTMGNILQGRAKVLVIGKRYDPTRF